MNIYYGEGLIRIESAINIRCIEILYTGTAKFKIIPPQDAFIISANDNKIIGANLLYKLPEAQDGALLSYEGAIRISKVSVVDEYGNGSLIPAIYDDLSLPQSMNTNVEDITRYPENQNTTYKFGDIPASSTIEGEKPTISNENPQESTPSSSSSTGGY